MEKFLQIIYFTGTILEIIGSYLLYKNAWPKGVIKSNQGFMGNGDFQETLEMKKQEKLSKIGFALICIGFLVQSPINFSNMYKSICP